MDCGRRPHLPKICAQSDTPLQKTLISTDFAAMTAISTNRTSTTRFLWSHRWSVYVTPKSPKGWLKTRIFTFGIALCFFVTGNRRHFKFNMWVEHTKSQLADDKTSLKWAWPRHVTYFKPLVLLRYLWNGLWTTNCPWKDVITVTWPL